MEPEVSLFIWYATIKGIKRVKLFLFLMPTIWKNIQKEFISRIIFISYIQKSTDSRCHIESATHKLANQYRVTVVTSDGLEQLITSAQEPIVYQADSSCKICNLFKKRDWKMFIPCRRNIVHIC